MADQPSNEESRLAPPYVPFQTFEAFLERIKGTVTPTRIDPSVLRHLSGTAQSQLLVALKFLQLIKADGTVNESLKKLVTAYKTPAWKAELISLAKTAYGETIGGLDVAKATPSQLRERFRDQGIEGDTIEKSIRFYLMLLKGAEVQFSPLLKIRQRTRGAGKRPKSSAGVSRRTDDDGDDPEPPEGMFEIPFGIIGRAGSVLVPDDITVTDWEKIAEYVKFVVGLRPHNVRAQMKAEKDKQE